MRLEKLTLRGFSSAFPGLVELPLRDLDAGVIAITGANGHGKTTLIEAMAPAAIYRQLPARNGEDPVTYATGRDSFIDLEYTIDARGAFRSRLNLDGPKRQTDAVLEAILPDGTHAPLNDGKRSTYDAAIAARFPSFDLFINSCFAGQGRGDEFTRRKPSQRKDLFVEFLALQHYARMAAAAVEAAALYADARLRLEVQVEALERDTAPAILADLDRQANALQVESGQAEVRQRELRALITDLEARAAVAADQVAAYAASQLRVRTVQTDLDERREEALRLGRQLIAADQERTRERTTIEATRDAAVHDAANKIAGNEKIQAMAVDIRAAIAALEAIEPKLKALRSGLSTHQVNKVSYETDRRAIERALAALAPVEQQLERSRSDVAILETVPCEGAGKYAACQFLRNATHAQGLIAEFEARILPKAEQAERIGTLTGLIDELVMTIAGLETDIRTLETEKITHGRLGAYAAPLAAAEARIIELATARTTAEQTAAEQLAGSDRRHTDRVTELTNRINWSTLAVERLTAERAAAEDALTAAGADNGQAVQLQAELLNARQEWDRVTSTLATVASGRAELERRRQDLTDKRARLDVVRGRLARVEGELLEWKDLAKALGKGGLPDLEIDAAGPTISATCNALLLSCFGSRFSLELVTQTAKADGSGLKDEFTVIVTDNEAGGAARDIAQLSGGEKVVVQEALMCAIALFVNERSPMPIRTLWRDETGAALDPANAVRYVNMLRRVRELGGYHHCFFISHNPAAAALADAQIQVADGQARIVHPPFMEAAS